MDSVKNGRWIIQFRKQIQQVKGYQLQSHYIKLAHKYFTVKKQDFVDVKFLNTPANTNFSHLYSTGDNRIMTKVYTMEQL